MRPVAEFRFSDSLPDQADYCALFESTGWNEEYKLTPEELRRAICGSWFLTAVYDGENLAGTGRVISDGVFHALIVDVIVHPEYRHAGVGTAIMRRLLDRCRTDRIRDVQLFCAAGKAPFYEALGFRVRSTDAPGMDYCPNTASTGEGNQRT